MGVRAAKCDIRLRPGPLAADNHLATHNELLGDFLFAGIKPGRPGTARVEVTFDVSIEGILTMSAHDLDTGKAMKTTVRVTQS